MLGPPTAAAPSRALAPRETPETRTLRFRQRLWARLVRVFARIEVTWDRMLWGGRRLVGRLGPLQVVTYRGYGSGGTALVRGRVLEASVLERSLPADSRWRSFRRMLRRFNSREVPEAKVRASCASAQVAGATDDEGYFEMALSLPALQPGSGGWYDGEVEVVEVPVRGFQPVRATLQLLVPPASAELGVISDIDDTVLQTHVTQKLKMIWVTLSGSAFTRMPFEGTSELYRALAAGKSGSAENPVFYVSKSPWNLYDFLVDFMDHHQLPRGPLLLRDFGLHETPPLDHKSTAVQRLLEAYPELPFVLIGDSGERDPDIYLSTAALYPGRIRAIYIRDVGGRRAGKDHAAELCEKARAYGTEMLWVDHAHQALSHARALGLIR
jgi:phosphatidate phosphatase APP1